MDNDKMSVMKKIAQDIRDSQKDAPIDYNQMTAPCGLPCFECYLHLAGESGELQTMLSEAFGIPFEQALCKGCRNEGGKCAHLPVSCTLYPCAEEKGVEFCCDCSEFPCDRLHPYADMAKLWHNTKVFNLCLIKKMGLESWAQNKAKSVLEVYSFENWKL
ncbi:DUF3795 domain-containing protein [Desulfobacterales bacterium HSG2]|nr:DUF3795 domain-containing protein [Desulfobacterales bacterium HSG2]